ncbi:MAG: phosphohydrolase [Candidatus Marinimicrobia bacterium]|nr:phosphohydrolase [Candidatus Neomarinimicrobiota bacterium]|tara:strand:- start:5126 stop:6715 length:1590 start_codon:yes stop_codon:yes gene_type:complete
MSDNTSHDNLQKLINIGRSLSREKNINILLEKILIEAREISHSDGGTLYLMTDDNRLSFEIMHNESKNIFFGGSSAPVPDSFYPVKLYVDGVPNDHSVSAVCALKGKTIHIEDAYADKNYDFSGAKGFDQKHGYHSKSFLNVPLKNHKDEILGVLQLLNATENDKIISYSKEIISLVEALTSQASIALTNQMLIEEQKALFKSFIQLVSEALEHKDEVTGGHCTRVPVLTMMFADAINEDATGAYKKFKFTDDQMEELYVAGWLHDFGKVATPEHIMNKSTKLECLFDKINLLIMKFEILKRDKKIEFYKNCLNQESNEKELRKKIDNDINQIDNDVEFLKNCNIGGEFMSDEMKERVDKIADQLISVENKQINILSNNEKENLKISRGTLSDKDFFIMKEHVSLSYELLNKLPYPKHLKNVPFYAGCHHEKIDGSGYPNGYKGDKLPLQARVIALADVFEGLTAPDRPYKKGYSLSKAMEILKFMVQDNEIDKDLFELFINKKLYLKYAKDYVDSSQIDEIDEKKYLI